MSEHANTNGEIGVETYERLVGYVGAHLLSEEADRFMFISVNEDDVPFSCSFPGVSGSEESVRSESEMLAEYIRTICEREGKDPESVLRMVISEINNGGIGEDDE